MKIFVYKLDVKFPVRVVVVVVGSTKNRDTVEQGPPNRVERCTTRYAGCVPTLNTPDMFTSEWFNNLRFYKGTVNHLYNRRVTGTGDGPVGWEGA